MVTNMKKIVIGLCVCVIFLSACSYDSGYLENEVSETETEDETIDIEGIKAQYVRLPKSEGEIPYNTESIKIEFEGNFMALNDKGVYYYLEDYKNDDKFRVWYKKYGQEQAECVFEAEPLNYLISNIMTDKGLVLEINPGSYTEEWLLTEDISDTKMLFRKDEMRLPEIAMYQEWLYVSYTLQKEGKSLLYKINLNDMSKEMIYETSIEYDEQGRANGERIVFSGGTEECLYFQILGLKNQYDEECDDRTLYKYQNGKIEEVMKPDDILVVMNGINDKLLIAEYATDEPWRDTCSIIDTSNNEVLGYVEGISPGSDIRKALVYDKYILFTNYYSMYIYDTELNKLETITVEAEHSQIDIFENKFSYYDYDSKCACIVSVGD